MVVSTGLESSCSQALPLILVQERCPGCRAGLQAHHPFAQAVDRGLVTWLKSCRKMVQAAILVGEHGPAAYRRPSEPTASSRPPPSAARISSVPSDRPPTTRRGGKRSPDSKTAASLIAGQSASSMTGDILDPGAVGSARQLSP